MPLSIQRINAKRSQPNERIVFIKPLKCKDEAIAQDFLERIAAQCLPIMKEHHLSVTTLEEYEANREFVGRNFNAGEIIQLVLKSRAGHWLPFRYVQMVMMHELAHNAQMNHSRAFWKVRNLYAEQMRTLWGRGYTGEGLWGRGALLATGEFEEGTMAGDEELPEHLCGGTYRSRRRRKRGRKGGASGDLTYQERKQRRIEKKFGKNGVALGADDDVKARLEKGKRTQAAPRVAGSNRGRELRAAAALARFDQNKQEVKEEPEDEEDGESESDYEDDIDPSAEDALDIDGRKLLDTKGCRMVKVCEDDNATDDLAANEIKELQSSIRQYFHPNKSQSQGYELRPGSTSAERAARSPPRPRMGSDDTAQDTSHREKENPADASIAKYLSQPGGSGTLRRGDSASKSNELLVPQSAPQEYPSDAANTACAVCSFQNEPYTVTCNMCLHVLDPSSVPGTWHCEGAACTGSTYLNAGDCGSCGLCGQRKTSSGTVT